MRQIKVWIQIESSQDSGSQADLQMNEKYMKRLGLPIVRPVALRFGSHVQYVRVSDTSASTKSVPYLKITSDLAGELGFVTGDRVYMQYDDGRDELRLGPVFGILTDQTYKSESDGVFGPNTGFFEEVTRAARRAGSFVYIFTSDDVDLQNKSIKGFRYSNRKWTSNRFPLPDVIHNRLTSRRLEQEDHMQKLLNQLTDDYHIPLFNHRFLDKIEVTKLLSGNDKVRPYLPETITTANRTSVVSMFRKYPVLYIKPSSGSLGQGIIKITRSSQGWKYIQNTMNGTVHGEFRKGKDALRFVIPRLKKGTYLIQRGIPLVRSWGQPVDFRALLQKDETDNWNVTSIVARTASSQSFVSNVAQGGKLSKVADALKSSSLPNNKVGVVQKRLREVSAIIAEAIEDNADGIFAELGIDLGVDPTGKVWLIEINSKPSKTEDSSLTEGKIRPSVKRMLSYVKHLAFDQSN